MKIASTPKSKRALVMSVAAVIIVAATAYGAYKYLGASQKEGNTPSSQTADTQSNQADSPTKSSSGNEQKQSYIDQSKNSDSSSGSSTTSSKQSTSVLVTHKGQDGSTLQLRVLISAVTTGKCELTMTKTGQTPVSKEADIQPMADSSTCKGFDVDTSNLAKGTWNFTIKITSPDYIGSVKDKVDVS